MTNPRPPEQTSDFPTSHGRGTPTTDAPSDGASPAIHLPADIATGPAVDPPGRETRIPDEPLIDIRALATWLSVSESIVRKWTAKGPESGLVPKFIRLNGQIRFRPADVRAFLAEREVQ